MMDKTRAIDNRMAEWQTRADRRTNYQKTDPFSGSFHSEDTAENHTSSINSRVTQWQQNATKHQNYQKTNPLAKTFRSAHYQNLGSHQDDANYGCPIQGSRTEFRGKAAGVHISSEIVELCGIIREMGTPLADGSIGVRFGPLFECYTRISNKVVGMLMRARRQGLVDFAGEMLYQRRDDDVIIRLIQMPEDLMEEIEKQKDELKHHPASRSLKP